MLEQFIPISTALQSIWPFLPVVFGLVEFARQLGAKGKVLLVISLLLGALCGVSYWLALFGVPTTWLLWFSLGIFSIMIGLTTSGIYNFVDARWPRLAKVTGELAIGEKFRLLTSLSDVPQPPPTP